MAKKFISEPTTVPTNENRNTNISIIFVQWNRQRTKEWVDVRQCSLMVQTSHLRNRRHSMNRNDTAKSASTLQCYNHDISYICFKNAWNNTACAAHGKVKNKTKRYNVLQDLPSYTES